MKILAQTPDTAVLAELGRRLELVRKQRSVTQDQLSEQAGLGVATLRRIEDGKDGRLGSWIRILRALDMSHSLDQLLPEDLRSPMQEARDRTRRRGRPDSENGFTWGDETR